MTPSSRPRAAAAAAAAVAAGTLVVASDNAVVEHQHQPQLQAPCGRAQRPRAPVILWCGGRGRRNLSHGGGSIDRGLVEMGSRPRTHLKLGVTPRTSGAASAGGPGRLTIAAKPKRGKASESVPPCAPLCNPCPTYPGHMPLPTDVTTFKPTNQQPFLRPSNDSHHHRQPTMRGTPLVAATAGGLLLATSSTLALGNPPSAAGAPGRITLPTRASACGSTRACGDPPSPLERLVATRGGIKIRAEPVITPDARSKVRHCAPDPRYTPAPARACPDGAPGRGPQPTRVHPHWTRVRAWLCACRPGIGAVLLGIGVGGGGIHR